VGRDREQRRLTRALQAARTRRGGSAFLLGESGIGKTRLLNEVADLATEYDMRVWRGRGSAIGPTVPLRPLAEALLSGFRGRAAPDAPELAPYLRALGRLVPDWSDGTRAGTRDDPAEPLLTLAEAVLRVLVACGRDRGLLLVLDDLQEADTETLFVVEYLVDNVAASRVLVLGTVRSGTSSAVDLVRAADRRSTGTVLELRALDRDAVWRLAAACLETDPYRVPVEVADLLWDNSAGNPFVVEELVRELVDTEVLVCDERGWCLAGELAGELPVALRDSVDRRVDTLGENGRALVSAAAVVGHRFPTSVVQQVTGLADRDLVAHLQAAVAVQLLVRDNGSSDWYRFRHPLTAEAVLRTLAPVSIELIARQAADAVRARHPGLPGDWCALVGKLLLTAGDTAGAGAVFAMAGRRALTGGALGTAVSRLVEAAELLAEHPDGAARAHVLEDLVRALGESGQFHRALQMSGHTELAGTRRTAGLHAQLAWAANLAGRVQDGLAQVQAARALLGSRADPAQHAALDAVEASLLLGDSGRDNGRRAESLAAGALRVAEREDLPDVACQSLQVLGTVMQDRDLGEAESLLERAREWTELHDLPLWRTHTLMRLGVHRMVTDGDGHTLELARTESRRTGATVVHCVVTLVVAMHQVLSGEFGDAEDTLAGASATVSRLRLADLAAHTRLGEAILAAHRADREAMDAALAAMPAGDPTPEGALSLGLAKGFCSLLEEDVDRARRELRAAAEFEERNHVRFRLSGRHGLRLLLDLLAGDLSEAKFRVMAARAPARLRWNRQFVLLGEAVLLGRTNRPQAADRMVDTAIVAGRPYPVAWHLGTRLVAEAAAADGWGEPVIWLREAEEYFHQARVPAVASACRALLRRVGAVVPQRRPGLETVPPELRAFGVTVREYEVLRLLGERRGNKEIGRRLHISPRTVEKHVARLIAKTFRPDRAALSEYAATLRG
jgi:hypothetical protein